MLDYPINDFKLVDRVSFIKKLCTGKRVLHLGATDAPETLNAIKYHRFLHSDLEAVASKLLGMDINKQMIDFLSENYKISNILYGNIEEVGDYPSEEFDIVVAGEILEHLSNPGKALESINQVLTNSQLLVITVPNAYSFKGFCRAVFGYEFIHEDHVLHHSPYTLKSLLARHGFKIEQSFSFVNGGTGIASNIANFILKGMPQLAEGIGVVCSKNIK